MEPKPTQKNCPNIKDSKNDGSLLSLRNFKKTPKMQKKIGVLVPTAMIVNQFWTTEKITPRSALL